MLAILLEVGCFPYFQIKNWAKELLKRPSRLENGLLIDLVAKINAALCRPDDLTACTLILRRARCPDAKGIAASLMWLLGTTNLSLQCVIVYNDSRVGFVACRGSQCASSWEAEIPPIPITSQRILTPSCNLSLRWTRPDELVEVTVTDVHLKDASETLINAARITKKEGSDVNRPLAFMVRSIHSIDDSG